MFDLIIADYNRPRRNDARLRARLARAAAQSWVRALRRAAGDALRAWHGELDITPPPDARRPQLRLDDDWSAEDLREPRARLSRPDAVLELARDDGDVRIIVVEYDRTSRVDKNCDKFRRYDAFLCWWWRHTRYASHPAPPFVLFICQAEAQRAQFVTAADHQLTGHRWHPNAGVERHEYVGRRRILFALEHDAHNGQLEAWQLPAFPPGHPARDAAPRATRWSSRRAVREHRRVTDRVSTRPPRAIPNDLAPEILKRSFIH